MQKLTLPKVTNGKSYNMECHNDSQLSLLEMN